MTLSGHAWTVGEHVRRALTSQSLASEHWRLGIQDERQGTIQLTGRLSKVPGADTLLVIVHGLGGSCHSAYMTDAAVAAAQAGHSSLRLNLRGADLLGEDYFHAGLTSDLAAVVRDPRFAAFKRIALLGFSLGGHLCLRFGLDYPNANICKIATVCPPLDLARNAEALDSTALLAYRWYVLNSLKRMYRAVARRRHSAIPIAEAMRIRSIVEWDERVVAPRFGFEGAADYYRKATVGPLLNTMKQRCLLVWSDRDPMVPKETVEDHLLGTNAAIRSHRISAGGHLAFSRDLDIGAGKTPGLNAQICSWLGEEGA